ncbi:PD40 domain-containing protein [candidate division KSB1 bacterium]|nr:PD40 domain-containing protein [candidate division KSB1 bacterium]
MQYRKTKFTLTLLLTLFLFTTVLNAQTKLLRFPDIHEDQVVFCYAGDLWKASISGGLAVRLTAHPGQELFPNFSPDGKWIAFTGQYDGDEQVYIIPAEGGVPQKLTYYPAQGPLPPRWGYDNQVYGWTPDGKKVLFRTNRDGNGGTIQCALYSVDINGGLPEKLPMLQAGAGDFAPNGQQIVYSPLFRDFRSWKRYQGGWAQDLYIFDLNSLDTKQISPSKRTERDPMWIGNTIYFASDRDGTLNLYSYDTTTDETKQLTQNTVWDVRWASSDNKSQIVYELNGELNIYNITTATNEKLSITVPDDGLAMRPSHVSVAKNIEDFELSPKGERALFIARGDVFTAPIEKGPTRNLTNSSNSHEKSARWSPDGKNIAFISDMTGEEQIYLIDQEGKGKSKQLTKDLKALLLAPVWSPDGEKLAIGDKDGILYVVYVKDGKVERIADDAYSRIYDYAWSPNGGHLAFSMSNENRMNSLYIWSVSDKKLRKITEDYFESNNPAWDPNGDYLYYLSNREFAPQISRLEWNYAANRNTGIFAMALRKDVKHPFPPQSDEVSLEVKDDTKKEDEKKSDDKKKEEPPKKEYIKIDFDGLTERVAKVPVECDNINGLSATKEYLLYMTTGAGFYGRQSYDKPALNIFDIKKREAKLLADEVATYALSSDGSKVLVRQGPNYNLFEAKPGTADKKTVSTAGLSVDRVPKQEWAQIFDEVWRRYRDLFYVKNMHGYDWKAIGDRYRGLLKYVAHRSDLNYVLSEMIAELNTGHCYIEGGDYEIPDRPQVALPGAKFQLDENAGRYKISKIYQGSNEEPKYRAPLTEVGVDANVGDYILAIDGVELKANDNPYRLLSNKTNPVTFTLSKNANETDSREVTFNPIFNESNLIYLDWVSNNMKKVDEMTDGRVGYFHVPDMSADGIYEFIKWYYPQIRKQGLVVDVRSNGGGNVSQWIIERLDTRMLGTRFGFDSEEATTYPYTAFHGHMVCLINETSASDGDIFPHYFREAGLGPLIGQRTWGGVVGITSFGPLIDGGNVFVPMRGTNDREGNWIIEGHGVDPDIEVENDPKSEIQGKDPQLERGVQEVLKKIKAEPKTLPPKPADPVKTK